MKGRHKELTVVLLFTLFAFKVSYCADATKAKPLGEYCDLATVIIDQISNGQDKTMRGNLTEDLNSFIHYFPECGRDIDTIKSVAYLLGDKNDRVRFYAAAALGNIGAPAQPAVPALERALRESDTQLDAFTKERGPGAVLLPTSYSGQAMRAALQKITGKHVPAYYETH